MRSLRAARAYQTHHRAARARRLSRPGHLTTDNRAPNTGIPRARAQMGARSRVMTNIQAPNTVRANRRRAVKDMSAQNTGENRVQVTWDQPAPAICGEHPASDRKAPSIRPRHAARPPHPFQFHIARRGLRVQPAQSPVQPRLPRPRRPSPPYQPCRELRRPQPQHPRLRHPRQPRLRQQRRRHNSPQDRTRRPPAARRMSRGILGMPPAAAPGGMQPRSRPPRARWTAWRRSRSRPHTLRGRGVRRERRMAPRRPADARRRS